MQPLVKIENLDVIYFLGKSNQVNALSKINAEIFPGEFVIFFGPSGCGKSTLLNSIAGLEQATHGNVFVADRNLTKFNQKELEEYRQKKIGMIFQAYYLINSLSVLKNVTLPQLSLNTGIKEREEKAMQLMEHFGIAEQVLKIPAELSGGQQQRVAISRSLINNPEIILADEPTGNLDSKSDFDVMELLREMNSKDKKTVILVTHSPTHLHYANRVFFMKDGAIIDTKVNRALFISEQPAGAGLEAHPLINKDLELLTKAFAMLTNATADQLIPIKAQEIVTESLTDMTAEEMTTLNKKVEIMLTKRFSTNEEIFKYLDEDEARGGLAMNKLQAQKLADKITKIVAEIKVLEKDEKIASPEHREDAEVKEIRKYLFDIFDIKVTSLEAVWNVNRAIKERLENKINGAEVQKKFDLPVTQGGAGMDKRTARHAARRLELLILGKYNPNKTDKQPPPKMPPASTQVGPTNNEKETASVVASETKQPLSARLPRRLWLLAMTKIKNPKSWISAFAEMTRWLAGMTKKIVEMTARVPARISRFFTVIKNWLYLITKKAPVKTDFVYTQKEKIIPLFQNFKQLLSKIGSGLKKSARDFSQILYNAAMFWSNTNSSKPPKSPLPESLLLPPTNLPVEITNEPPTAPAEAKAPSRRLAVNERELALMSAVNRVLQKFVSLPVRAFNWLKKVLKKWLEKF